MLAFVILQAKVGIVAFCFLVFVFSCFLIRLFYYFFITFFYFYLFVVFPLFLRLGPGRPPQVSHRAGPRHTPDVKGGDSDDLGIEQKKQNENTIYSFSFFSTIFRFRESEESAEPVG